MKKITLISICAIYYAGIVISDYILGEYIKNHILVNDATKIQNERIITEDRLLKLTAREEGYKSVIYTALYSAHWKSLAEGSVAPLGSQPNTNLYYCNEGYGLIKFKTDRFGFRNKDEIWDSNKIDAIIVGDSYVHGACVEDSATISEKLISRGVITLNMGIAVDGPMHYAARIKVFGEKIKPKWLVVVFYSNDNIEDNDLAQ